MNWCTINSDYLDFLRETDKRVPQKDYGANAFKPFFAPLFEKDGLVYVANISSAKNHHVSWEERPNFKKIEVNNVLVGVVNLDYMIPVPKSEIENINYTDIEKFRNFPNEISKKKYVALLDNELKEIIKKDIATAAKKFYDLLEKNPNHYFSKRCLNFKLLEEKSHEYIKEKYQGKLNEINKKLKEKDSTKKSDLRIKIYDELSSGEYSLKKKELKIIEVKFGNSSNEWSVAFKKLENFKNTLLPQDEADKKVSANFKDLKEEIKSLESEKKSIKKENPGLKDNYKKIDREKGMER